MMQYNLKDKIKVTTEFLSELISKSWQEAESIQQQISNIDTSNQLGANVVKLLKNTCTSYYTLVGCLEALVEEPVAVELSTDAIGRTNIPEEKLELVDEPMTAASDEELPITAVNQPPAAIQNFEPFEYFVDFDEPAGDPVTDEDLYS